MRITSPRAGTAQHPSATVTMTATAGPLLLAVGWLLVEYLPNSPVWIATARVLPAGLILLALRPAAPTGVWWYRSVILGAVNFAGFFICQAIAVHFIPPGVAATIAATQTLLVPLGARVLLATPLRIHHLLFAATGILGVALIVGHGPAQLHPHGIAAAAGSALCNAIGLLLTRRWGHPPDVHHLTATGWQLTAGGALLTPWAMLTTGSQPTASAATLAVLAVLALTTAAAFAAIFGALHSGLAPSTISRLMLLCPLTVTATGWAVHHQSLTTLQLTGVLLIVAPIALTQPTRQRPLHTTNTATAPSPQPRATAPRTSPRSCRRPAAPTTMNSPAKYRKVPYSVLARICPDRCDAAPRP